MTSRLPLVSLALLTIVLLFRNVGSAGAETYQYEALPAGDGTERELMDMEIVPGPNGITYFSRNASPHGTEEIHILTDRTGRLIAASKRLAQQNGKVVDQAHIRLDDNRARLTREQRDEEKSFELPNDMPPAVDGSLLLLLRFFPFDTGEARQAFMVDFSGPSVTVTFRQTGVEKITVPAGEFTCYRIELLVNIPLFKPKILYWISAAPPHFLVKSLGKRGPFTSSYETSLLSIRK